MDSAHVDVAGLHMLLPSKLAPAKTKGQTTFMLGLPVTAFTTMNSSRFMQLNDGSEVCALVQLREQLLSSTLH